MIYADKRQTLYSSNLKRRSEKENMVIRRVLFGCVVFLSIICCILIIKNNSYAANEPSERTLCYRPILVEPGDSLWSIASDNMTEEWGSIDKYVKAIKEFNNLDTFDIYAGTYISIPYYDVVK